MMRAQLLWCTGAVVTLGSVTACQFPSYNDDQIVSFYGGRRNASHVSLDSKVKDDVPIEKPALPEPGQGGKCKNVPAQVGWPGPDPVSGPPVGEPCVGGHDHSGQICLGLKYVVYQDRSGDPIETDRDAIDNVREVNLLWRECDIQFQIDRYVPVVPDQLNLRYRTANHWELNDIRRKFMDDTTLLVVTTGKWDRSGTLGSSWANAWTNLPGEGLYGSILERTVGRNSNILAHELGHYLSLDHVADPSSLMNPLIYPTSTQLSRRQCEAARWAAGYFWGKMTHGTT